MKPKRRTVVGFYNGDITCHGPEEQHGPYMFFDPYSEYVFIFGPINEEGEGISLHRKHLPDLINIAKRVLKMEKM